MERKNWKRLAAVLLSVMFVLSLIFSFVFITSEADHECSGENCEICQLIDLCLDLIGRQVPLIIICMSAVFFFDYFICENLGLSGRYNRTTPVILKTRLNN